MKSVLVVWICMLSINGSFAQVNEHGEVIRTYYDDGGILAETTMKNGKKNGVERLYYRDGSLMIMQHYKDNMYTDSFYSYDKRPPHKLASRGYVVPVSRVVMYDAESNKIMNIADYKVNDTAEGLIKFFYKNGNVQLIGEHKKGESDGVEILYYNNGNVMKIRHYLNGEIIPPIYEFDSLGKVIYYRTK